MTARTEIELMRADTKALGGLRPRTMLETGGAPFPVSNTLDADRVADHSIADDVVEPGHHLAPRRSRDRPTPMRKMIEAVPSLKQRLGNSGGSIGIVLGDAGMHALDLRQREIGPDDPQASFAEDRARERVALPS